MENEWKTLQLVSRVLIEKILKLGYKGEDDGNTDLWLTHGREGIFLYWWLEYKLAQRPGREMGHYLVLLKVCLPFDSLPVITLWHILMYAQANFYKEAIFSIIFNSETMKAIQIFITVKIDLSMAKC